MSKVIKQLLFDFRLENNYIRFAAGKVFQEGKSVRMTNTADTLCLQHGIPLQINDAFTKPFLKQFLGLHVLSYFQAPDANLPLPSEALGSVTWLRSVTII